MKLSFTHKVLVAILSMILLMMGAITFFFQLQSRRIAEREIERRVQQTQKVFQNYENEIQNKLLAVNAYISGNSSFIAYMAEAIDNGDRDSLLDQYEEIRGFSNCDFMLVANPDGAAVASTMDFSQKEQESLAQLTRSAFEAPMTGHFRSGAQLFNLVVSPIRSGDYLNGFVFVGYRIDEKTAEEIGKITNCHILLLADEGNNKFSLVAAYYGDGKAFDNRAETELLEQLSRIEVNQYSAFMMGGLACRGLVGVLASPTGQSVGRYVTMKSLSQEMEAFRAINRGMWLIGLVTVLLMAPASVWAARRVTRPVNQLVGAIESVREGRYDEGKIQVVGTDEIGIMAAAFKGMVRELREQQELIQFLEKSARGVSSGNSDADSTIVLSGNSHLSLSTSVRHAALEAMKDLGTLPEGFLLGERYEIREVLGRGGMGVVYKAQDRSLDEVVAIKMVALGNDELVALLKNETKLARKVTHRNVVRIYDLGEIEGLPFVSMELVKGTTLKVLLRRVDQLPLSIALRISKQVMQGLSAAHAEGIVHGDIKPDNVIINSRGEVKVMDFGIARLAKTKMENETISGTPAYMPPEQFQGAPLDARSDIYSLGVMMFEIFTGHLPYPGNSVIEFFQKHLSAPVPRAKNEKPELPDLLSNLIYRAMAKKAEDRFPSITAMLVEIRDLS